MQDKLNEDLFDAVLQRVFCDYTDEQLALYPDCEALAKKYPLPKKEKRAFDRLVKEIKYGKSLVKVYLARAAVIFLCIIALGAGVAMTSPEVRAAARNVIIEWFDRYTLFTFISTDPGKNDFTDIKDVKIGYVPEGWKLDFKDDFPEIITYIYNCNDINYTIDVFENESTDLFPDNERSTYTKTEINGHETWIIYDEKNSCGTLILVGSKVSVSISGILPKEEFIKIAKSIK